MIVVLRIVLGRVDTDATFVVRLLDHRILQSLYGECIGFTNFTSCDGRLFDEVFG